MSESIPVLIASDQFEYMNALASCPVIKPDVCPMVLPLIYQKILHKKYSGQPYRMIWVHSRELSYEDSCVLYQKILQLDPQISVIGTCSSMVDNKIRQLQQEKLLSEYPGRLYFYPADTSEQELSQVLALFIRRFDLEAGLITTQARLDQLQQKYFLQKQAIDETLGVLVLNSETEVLEVNGYVTELTGWSLSALVRGKITEFFNLDLAKPEQTVQYEKNDGRYAWGIFRICPHASGYILLFRDITKEKAEERIKEYRNYQDGLIKAKQELRHNIGNTVNSMNSTIFQLQKSGESIELLGKMLQQFLQTHLDEKSSASYQFLQGIQAFWDKDLASQIVEPFSVLARDVSGLMRFFDRAMDSSLNQSDELVELNGLIADVIRSMTAYLEQNGVAIRFVEAPKAISLKVNENEIFHVFLNLIKNAVEAIVERAGENPKLIKLITIQFWGIGSKGVEVRVHDTAGSLSDSDMQKVFEQGHTTKAKGMGEGLHSVANFMRRYEGDICVTSSYDKGTEFCLTFPASCVILGD